MLDIIAGGVTGLLGTAVGEGIKMFRAKGERKHEVRMREMDMAEQKVETDAAIRQTAAQTDAQMEIAATETRQLSMTMDKASYVNPDNLTAGQQWLMLSVDWIRGMARPVLTFYLVHRTAEQAMMPPLPPDSPEGQAAAIINYLASTAVTWWFGGKAVEQGKLLKAKS